MITPNINIYKACNYNDLILPWKARYRYHKITPVPLIYLCFYNIFKMLLLSLLDSTNIYGKFTNH